MMYIEHTNLDDNLHQILTNREPTSSSPSASEATAAVTASALLARVREAHNSASSALQQQTSSSPNIPSQNCHNSSNRTPTNNYKPNLLSLENINSIDFTKELRRVLSTVRDSEAASGAIKKQVQEQKAQPKKGEKEEQYELLQAIECDQTAQAENSRVVQNKPSAATENCATASHFVIDINGKNIASSVPATASQIQAGGDEDFDYVITRVPKRKFGRSSTRQAFEDYSTSSRKVCRPVPESIPIDSYSSVSFLSSQPLPRLGSPIQKLKKYTFDSTELHNNHIELNGYSTIGASYTEKDNNYNYYSDFETVKATTTGCAAYAYKNDFHNRKKAQMGLDIINRFKKLFNLPQSSNQNSSDYLDGKRKRRSEDWTLDETAAPQQIKYRKVENRFPKYIAVRPEQDTMNEFLSPFSQHSQQQKYLLTNPTHNSKTLLEMSNRPSTSIDKPSLRKSMFTAPHITQQLIKNTTYADVEFSDDDEPILVKAFDIQPLNSNKHVPHVFNIPFRRTEERHKSTQHKPPPPPLIEHSTGNILQSSLIPRLETRHKQTYAEIFRQNGGTGHVLGSRNTISSSVASISESPRYLNGFNNLRTNHWSTQNRSSILSQEKESEEREKYQQLLEQAVPRLYGAARAENNISHASTSNAAQRRSALILDAALTSSARSSPTSNTRPLGVVPSFLKRPPLSSTINLDDDDSEEDVAITGVSHLKNSHSAKTKTSLPTTVIVDDDEISDIIDLGNEDRHVLSACAKIQKENGPIAGKRGEKIYKQKKDALPFVEPVNSLKDRFNTSPHIKDNWLEKFQYKWMQHKKNRHDEVKETVKVTEKLTAERRAAEAEIQERLRNFQIFDPELLVIDDFEDAIEELEFVELTQQHKARINDAICGAPDQVLVSKFNLNITRRDIHTLCSQNWLNDEVINFYMNLLTERGENKHDSHGLPKVYAMNTFFVPRLIKAGHEGVRRWTRKVNIFEKDIVPVPVHVGGVHWCMAIIHLKNRSIKYYDSMGTPNPIVLKALEQYLKDESMDKRKQPFDTKGFVIESVQGVPRQNNGSDCGVFSCMFAEYITRNREITFSQQNMEYFRQKMILEIVMGELLQ